MSSLLFEVLVSNNTRTSRIVFYKRVYKTALHTLIIFLNVNATHKIFLDVFDNSL